MRYGTPQARAAADERAGTGDGSAASKQHARVDGARPAASRLARRRPASGPLSQIFAYLCARGCGVLSRSTTRTPVMQTIAYYAAPIVPAAARLDATLALAFARSARDGRARRSRSSSTIVALSLRVSLTAVVLLAALVGLPLGAALAVTRFPGAAGADRRAQRADGAAAGRRRACSSTCCCRAPARSARSASCSRRRRWSSRRPILIVPIIAALARQVVEDAWREYREQLRSLGAAPLRRRRSTLLWDTRFSLVTVRARGLRPRGRRSRRGDDRRRQHRRRHARDDDHDRARDQQGRPAARARRSGIVLIAIVLLLNAAAHVRHEMGAQRASWLRPRRRSCRSSLEASRFVARRHARSSTASTLAIDAPGRARSILGPNGAGKSVLLRLLHGLLAADARARCAGACRARAAARRQAMVFQRPVHAAPLGARATSRTRSTLAGVRARASASARAHDALDARRPRARSPTGRRACCPAASSSASRSRARGRSSPKCCSSTSRPRASIPARRATIEDDHREHPRARHQDRHDHAQPRPGAAPGRRGRVPRTAGASVERTPADAFFRAAARRPKPRHSSKENCHGADADVDAFSPLVGARVLARLAARSRRTSSSSSRRRRRPSSRACSAHLLPVFEKKTGIEVRVVALGTGQALDIGAARRRRRRVRARPGAPRRSSSPKATASSACAVMYNDFVLIGPKADPGEGRGRQGHRSTRCSKIAAAKAPFVSRGDHSGTHAAELRYWKAAGVDLDDRQGRVVSRDRARAWARRSTPRRR